MCFGRVLVRFFAVVMRGGGMGLGRLMVAFAVVVGRFLVMVGGSRMMRGGMMMRVGGCVGLFGLGVCHDVLL